MQSGNTMDDPKRFRFEGDGYYLKCRRRDARAVDASCRGACDNTLLIAERIGDYDEVFAERNLMPQFPVPDGETQQSWLRKE